MERHNESVQNIIKTFISKSRKNSNDSNLSQPFRASGESQENIDPQDEQFIIRKRDLKDFVEKIASQTYDHNVKIQSLQQQIQGLKIINLKLAEKVEKATQFCQQNFRKNKAQLEIKYEGQKKKKEHLEREVKWSNNRIKEQLNEIQRMRHLISTKDSIIQKMKESENQNTANQGRVQYNHIARKKEIPQNGFSHQSNGLNDNRDESKRTFTNVKNKQIQNQQRSINKTCELKQRKQSMEEDKGKYCRHSDQDRKDKLLKQLGQKCIFLEAHIQMLTKKILGQFVPQKTQSIRTQVQRNNEDILSDKRCNTRGIEHIEDESSMIKLEID